MLEKSQNKLGAFKCCIINRKKLTST